MRFQTLLLLAALALQLPALAQEADYPTLEALATIDVPPFDHVDMVKRMTSKNVDHTPPAEPPTFEIGDRDAMWLGFGQDFEPKRSRVELRGMTDRVLIWAHRDVEYPNWRAQALARDLERAVLDPMQKLFQYAEPPGVDGDPRLIVAMIHDPDGASLGYFSREDAFPEALQAYGNEREMMVVNLAWDDEYDFFDEILIEVVAHEYLHILQYHSDLGEELWLDEGLAEFAAYRASKPYLSRAGPHIRADDFLQAPGTGLTQWQAVEERGPKYGAAFLFVAYLAQRFGDDIAARLLVEKANGWQSVDKLLREEAGLSADEVFADWVLANYFLDYRRGHGYKELDADLTGPEPTAAYNSFPATHESKLPQYGTDYIAVDVRGADKLLLRLQQEDEARLVNEATPEGDHFYFAAASDKTHNRLTRAFDLSEVKGAWLEFRLWHNLADDLEYGYVTISKDGGESWKALRGMYMSAADVYAKYYIYGYTGRRANWLQERINLTRHLPGKILLRFEVMSSYATEYGGMAIDDLRIREIDFHDGLEAPDDQWLAEGWIRTDNRLPNNTWLQVAQDTRDGVHVSRALVTGNGELSVDVLPGAGQALVAISPVVRQTNLPTEYDLELYLMDAAGEVMVVSRECTLTTTHALNFRAAPNGSKIGLLPKATTVDALDREGDWFKIDYSGRLGWVHGDYVHAAGKCP